MQTTIIGIAGESGVGKTVVANIIRRYLGEDKVLLLSADDLHKWDRHSSQWEQYGLTHLDPKANNLDMGDDHLRALSKGKSIERSIYDHNSGQFLPPVTLHPKQYIVNEGLHAFYTVFANDITKLKIYIDVDSRLKDHWKIIRDMRDRGYSLKEVKKNINRRKKDAQKIKVQMDDSDLIIKIAPSSPIKNIGDPSEVVFTGADFKFKKIIDSNDEMAELARHIQDYYVSINELVFLSHKLGNGDNFVIGGGGNISVKIGKNDLAVKSSGVALKEVSFESGYTLLSRRSFANRLKNIVDDESLDQQMGLMAGTQKRPSIESFFHLALKNKYVVHTHPKYLTAILSSGYARKVIKECFHDFNYKFIPYKNPGFDLGQEISKYPEYGLFFLENHGLIVAEDNPYAALAITECMENCARRFCLDLVEKSKLKSFPDAVVFDADDEMKERNLFTLVLSNALGENGCKTLTKREKEKILNMTAEKRRRA